MDLIIELEDARCLVEGAGYFCVRRGLVVEAFAHFGGHEWACFFGAIKEFVADSCDCFVASIADWSGYYGAGNCGQAPEAAEAVEDVEDGGGMGEEAAVGGGDDDAVG